MAFVVRPRFLLYLSSLAGEEIPESVIIVLVEGCVNERVEEGVGVTQPEEDTLPYRWNVTGAQRSDELSEEERDPAQDEHSDEDTHHQSRSLLLLFSPRLTIGLKCHSGMAHREDHLRLLPGGLFYLREQMCLERYCCEWISQEHRL